MNVNKLYKNILMSINHTRKVNGNNRVNLFNVRKNINWFIYIKMKVIFFSSNQTTQFHSVMRYKYTPYINTDIHILIHKIVFTCFGTLIVLQN